MAGAITTIDLFENQAWDFEVLPGKYSDEWGHFRDKTDARELAKAQSVWMFDPSKEEDRQNGIDDFVNGEANRNLDSEYRGYDSKANESDDDRQMDRDDESEYTNGDNVRNSRPQKSWLFKGGEIQRSDQKEKKL